MTALNLKAWKFKYLFHDIEKPWLRLIWPYEKVQKFHRKHTRHHIEYRPAEKIDWEQLVIDWECSRFTKATAQSTAMEQFYKEMQCMSQNKQKNFLIAARNLGLVTFNLGDYQAVKKKYLKNT